ncbi:MAG: histone deacetylase family protein [Deferrisomatales bacterium]
MTLGWIHHDFFARHRTPPDHPERAGRLGVIVEALEDAGLLPRMEPLAFRAAPASALCRAHEPAYVELLRLACEEGFGYIGDPETRLCRDSYAVAALAAGGVLAACDAVMEGRVGRAFCAVRPPGHHAARDRAMGFCLINHVAVAAEHLLARWGVERVAVVDFDVHHGNGTQSIFEARRDVLYLSLHENPLTLRFPGTGRRGEEGVGPGRGYTRNVYVPPGCGEREYRRTLAREVAPALNAFAPQVLLLSAGFDAAATESVAHVNLLPEAFEGITRDLLRAAQPSTGGRTVSVLEGGYDLRTLGRCAAAHVRALLGDSPPSGTPQR